LKLLSRIYDPTEGTILIDDRDIKTLKLTDLRAAMSILFQDYTFFPLSVSLIPAPEATVPNTRAD
jgi:ABC-type multidrug transport system fused ATPase/permease subunit